MDLLLLGIAVLGAVAAILILKVCLKYRHKKEETAVVVNREATTEPLPFNAGNVIPFPHKRNSSKVEGISDELWGRWVEISAMEHSKERADLLLELMYDTVRHINEEDKG